MWEGNTIMENDRLEGAIEAVLFSVGDAVPVNKLAEALNLDLKTTKNILKDMKEKYKSGVRGIQLIEIDGCYQLCSKSEHYDLIKKIAVKVKEVQLTDVLVETLAIVAYRQPITKAHIEAIRGVNSNHSVNKLLELGLVDEVGRMQAPGRPVLFGTSQNFLRAFGLKTVDELPFIEEDEITKIKEAVFLETNIRIEDLDEEDYNEEIAKDLENNEQKDWLD